ncbi:MAG: hypothetical protein HYR80_01660 [Nitrospirae bacterium]|nr:hypothetical protein [Nitrospirota bacterium]
MADLAVHFFVDAVPIDEKAQKVLTPETLPIFKAVHARLAETDFEHTALEEAFRSIGEGLGLKLSQVAQPVRAAVTGKTVSPGIFDVLILLGKEKTLKRLASQIDPLSSPPASK